MAGSIRYRGTTTRGAHRFQARLPMPDRPGDRREKTFTDPNRRRAERAAER